MIRHLYKLFIVVHVKLK